MTGFRKRHITIVIFFGSLVLLFFLPVLSGLRTFAAGDFTTLYHPYNIFFRNELAALHLPVWNPYAYSGHPFLADPQAAVFYPINDLFTLISSPWTNSGGRLYWLQLEAIFHFFLGGYFTFLFVRDLTNNRMAGLISGTTFMFSGYLTGYPALQLTILRTGIWLPLLLWLLSKAIADATGWRWWLWFAVAYAAAFLAGHPQTFIYLSYVTVLWGAFLIAGGMHRARSRLTKASQLAFRGGVVAIIFLGLIATQLIPSIEFIRLSVRADAGYDFLSSGASLTDFWQFLLPSIWSPFSPFYVGIIVTGLAGLGVFGALSMLSRGKQINGDAQRLAFAALFFAAIGVMALLVGLGKNAAIYPIFYHFAPGWKLFRNQERIAYLVTFSMNALAGIGVAWLPGLPVRLRKRYARAALGALLAGIVVFLLVWKIPLHLAIADRWFTTTVILTLIGIIILFLVLEKYPGQVWILVAFSLILLFYENWDAVQSPISLAEAATLPQAANDLKAASEDCSLETTPCALEWQGMPGRTYNEAHIKGGFGPTLALEDVWGTSPLRLQRYADLFENFPLERMWRLTGVEHVLTWRSELFESATLLNSYQMGEETGYLYRLNHPNPRAWSTTEIMEMPDAEAVQAMASYQIDLAAQAVLAPDAAARVARPAPATHANVNIHVQRLASNKLQLQARGAPGGLLILSENWMPGWRAVLVQDSQGNARHDRLTVVRADVTLLGIEIPDGGGTIEISYAPASIRMGVTITSFTLLLLISLTLITLSKNRQAHIFMRKI